MHSIMTMMIMVVVAMVVESKWTQITLFWQLWHASNISHEICECDHVSAVFYIIHKKNFKVIFLSLFYTFLLISKYMKKCNLNYLNEHKRTMDIIKVWLIAKLLLLRKLMCLIECLAGYYDVQWCKKNLKKN